MIQTFLIFLAHLFCLLFQFFIGTSNDKIGNIIVNEE
jgi:hypothetical protein